MITEKRKAILGVKNRPNVRLYRWTKRFLRGLIRDAARSFDRIAERRRSSQAFDLTMYVLQFLGVILIILSLSAACVFFQVGNRFDGNIYVVNIPKGYGANKVGDLLVSRGVIDGKYGFNLIVNMFGLEDRMQAGTYEFSAKMSLLKIVLRIRNGEVIPPLLAKIIFPEGISIYKMGQMLQKMGLSEGEEFAGLTNNAISDYLVEKYRYLRFVPNGSLEGYLFPDTYLIQSDVSAKVLADLMLSRFSRVVMPYWRKHTKDTKYTLHEILSLASIIEKEATRPEERYIISSVFHNRLNIRMHLGADPTIKYALERPHKLVSLNDLEVDSPYNTYKRYGLPPGPICSPGIESIKAAIYPAKTEYLYFVAKADGSHVFSKTWQEHEDAKQSTRIERIRKIYSR